VQDGSLIPRFGRARRDPSLAVLEGFHPLKHALRFGANVLEVVCRDGTKLERLAMQLAPDLRERLHGLAREVNPALFAELAPFVPSTGVISLAERPPVDPAAMLADARSAPLILLEDPRDLGNMGACVRVAAADAFATIAVPSSATTPTDTNPALAHNPRTCVNVRDSATSCRARNLETVV